MNSLFYSLNKPNDGGLVAPTPSPPWWYIGGTGLYDATSGGSAVVSDAATIKRWENQGTGGSSHLTQGTTTNAPVLKTAIANGYPVTRFDGNDNLNWASPPSGDNTIIIVMRMNLAAASHPQFANLALWGNPRRGYVAVKGNTSTGYWGSWTSAELTSSPVDSLATGTTHILAADFKVTATAKTEIFRNGVSKGSAAAAVGGGTAAANQIGGDSAFSRYFTGDIAEIVAFSTISSTIRKQWEAYFGLKYSVTVTP